MLDFKREHAHEHAVRRLYREQGATAAPVVHYGYDKAGVDVLHVLTSREPWGPGDERWHVSISARDGVPSWDQVAYTLHTLRPGVPFVMGVPPRSWWMNVHGNVLHAWETKDQPLIDEWRANRQGDTT